MSKNLIKIQTEDFNHAGLFSWLQDARGQNGAIVSFTGLVRDRYENDLQHLFLEHYPGMTEKCLLNIVEQARERWQLGNVAVIHRVGKLHVNDHIVFVAVVCAHREQAFMACQFIMDYLKKDAPFWKKEALSETEDWVAQKQSDLDAAQQWQK